MLTRYRAVGGRLVWAGRARQLSLSVTEQSGSVGTSCALRSHRGSIITHQTCKYSDREESGYLLCLDMHAGCASARAAQLEPRSAVRQPSERQSRGTAVSQCAECAEFIIIITADSG
ncbi:hypothetical protein GBF38_004992 [Nibea albiflora]|uniref:Uncharacterized protein n=1 Tax=Nibea albiflora TaxID=240163 RepID=A0ACB7EVQ1_NIBAL|nr:hypothetical protein GBF38_004992 [Nibea albiflora]